MSLFFLEFAFFLSSIHLCSLNFFFPLYPPLHFHPPPLSSFILCLFLFPSLHASTFSPLRVSSFLLCLVLFSFPRASISTPITVFVPSFYAFPLFTFLLVIFFRALLSLLCFPLPYERRKKNVYGEECPSGSLPSPVLESS